MATATRKAALTRAEAADYLGLKVQTLANWKCLGIGPRTTGRGKGLRYRLTELDRWNDANTT